MSERMKQVMVHFQKAPAVVSRERVLRFVASTGEEDRDGDTIAPDGIVTNAFQRNPVFLALHDSRGKMPIGKVVSTEVRGGNFEIEVEFPDPEDFRDEKTGDVPEHIKYAEMVRRLYQRGFMNGVSIGFIPLEASPRPEGKGFHFSKVELLEVSAVPIPSNRGALQVRSYDGPAGEPADARELAAEIAQAVGVTLADVVEALEDQEDDYTAEQQRFANALFQRDLVACSARMLETLCERAGVEIVDRDPLGWTLREPAEKAGRVLSRQNLSDLNEAKARIDAVIERGGGMDDEDEKAVDLLVERVLTRLGKAPVVTEAHAVPGVGETTDEPAEPAEQDTEDSPEGDQADPLAEPDVEQSAQPAEDPQQPSSEERQTGALTIKFTE